MTVRGPVQGLVTVLRPTAGRGRLIEVPKRRRGAGWRRANNRSTQNSMRRRLPAWRGRLSVHVRIARRRGCWGVGRGSGLGLGAGSGSHSAADGGQVGELATRDVSGVGVPAAYRCGQLAPNSISWDGGGCGDPVDRRLPVSRAVGGEHCGGLPRGDQAVQMREPFGQQYLGEGLLGLQVELRASGPLKASRSAGSLPGRIRTVLGGSACWASSQ